MAWHGEPLSRRWDLGTEGWLDIPRRPESTWGLDGILGNRIRRLSDRRVSAQRRRTSWTPTLTGAQSHRRGCSQLPDGQEPLPGHRWAEAVVSGPRRAVVGGCWTQQSPPPRPSPSPAPAPAPRLRVHGSHCPAAAARKAAASSALCRPTCAARRDGARSRWSWQAGPGRQLGDGRRGTDRPSHRLQRAACPLSSCQQLLHARCRTLGSSGKDLQPQEGRGAHGAASSGQTQAGPLGHVSCSIIQPWTRRGHCCRPSCRLLVGNWGHGPQRSVAGWPCCTKHALSHPCHSCAC